MQKTRWVAAAAIIATLMTAVSANAATNDYSNGAYRQHDIDNVSRSTATGRQRAYISDPAYNRAFTPAAAESFLANQAKQIRDVPYGRQYLTLGQVLPGGSVGDPTRYRDMTPLTIGFLSRTGAKLVGRLWWDEKPGPHPGIVITPGSLQGTQSMYWWAARALAKQGYLVLTFDTQGQGESETFGHEAGKTYSTTSGFPAQQEATFVDGTVDALRLLFATDAAPYVPGGWNAAQVRAARAAGDSSLSWINPLAGNFDRANVGLAGHSLGASAASAVQQCSDTAELWKKLAFCTGRSFPIKAVVAWDGLSAQVEPVVPSMNQQGDGYFTNPTPSYAAPDPTSSLGGFKRWQKAKVDSYSIAVRGGTHIEWVDVPYILPSTTYGIRLAERYTVAWMNRYVSPDAHVRANASAELLAAPKRRAKAQTQQPWRADFMSARRLSAFAFRDVAGNMHRADDLRVYGGTSRVGDWTGANNNKPKVAP